MSLVEKEEYNTDKNTGMVPSEESLIDKSDDCVDEKYEGSSICDKLDLQYRLFRHKIFNFFNIRSRNRMVQVVYITMQTVPTDYILALQKQYPNKEIKVIVPIFDYTEDKNSSTLSFDFYYRNRIYEAKVIKYSKEDNIWVYGIYSEAFSSLKNCSEMNALKYLSPYAKCARIFAKNLKADIIHSDEIPFYLGSEFEKKQKNIYNVLQMYHHIDSQQELEPFWAAINLSDKYAMEKIYKDKIIKKYLSKLFNLKGIKKQQIFDRCIDYFYENYEKYRQEVGLDQNIEPNTILRNLNKRIIKLFPDAFNKTKRMFNVQYYSSKKSNQIVLLSKSSAAKNEFAKKTVYMQQGFANIYDNKIIYNFDKDNFRNIRTINKSYLQREFAKSKIESKFTDKKLIQDEEVTICGYLDVIRTSAVVFATFEKDTSEEEYKSVIIPVLKAFELNKDIQFIINVKNASENSYIKSLVDFFESQKALDGRWLYLDGEINLPQFLAASDVLLVQDGECRSSEEVLYTSLKYGCIPVFLKKLEEDYMLKDIFDDMTTGCCFKLSYDSLDETASYEELLLKVLNFYFSNSSSWNLIMQNAMNYDSSWNFDKIQAFNILYDKLA